MRVAPPLAALLALVVLPVPVVAETVLLEAVQDATLVEHPDGLLANGAGPAVFAGRTSQAVDGVRRALIRFEAPAALPPRAIVERVALLLQVLPGNDGPRELRVHRVLAPWTEGLAASGGGGGAPAGPGDATWVHASFPHAFWLHNGGQFEGAPLAAVPVDGPGAYRVESRALARAVALWTVRPQANFGLLVIGDETARQTARALASREHPDPAFRPALEITFRTAP